MQGLCYVRTALCHSGIDMVQAMQNNVRMLCNAAQAFVLYCEPGFKGCVMNLKKPFESCVNSDMHMEARQCTCSSHINNI